VEDFLVFTHITKKFPGVIALNDVSFPVRKGEIHAVVGENGAGKSTLMNILGGEYPPDEGKVLLEKKELHIPNPYTAHKIGISIVYQELKLCPNLNVVENIFLGREKEQGSRRANWRRLADVAAGILDSLGANISPREVVKRLSISEQQQVEIAKAISMNSKILILDEPTSALTLKEVNQLFNNLLYLKEKKEVTIIFISHRLEEVFEISDRITILRDGKYLGTFDTNRISKREVVTLIAGKKLASELQESHSRQEEGKRAVLEIKNLNRDRFIRDVSLTLYEKEILGIYGLQGAGRTELLETIFGIFKPDSGEVYINGRQANIRNPKSAIRSGIALIPEDRRRVGLFLNFSVKENICVSILEKLSRMGFIVFGSVNDTARTFVRRIGVKVSDIGQSIGSLSGGNQQKVIISRWLATEPRIFLMDEPTRGIDVGAKVEIFSLLRKMREEGVSILFVSSELQEIISETDRVIVMRNGRVVSNLKGKDINKETVLHYAMQG
jgi:ABC-type sugar transport system ATPase subunit